MKTCQLISAPPNVAICFTRNGKFFPNQKQTSITKWLQVKDICPLCNNKTTIEDLRAHPTQNSSFQPQLKNDKDEICYVCHAQIYEKALKARCSHLFHIPCLENFLEKRDLCPECRQPFIKEFVIEITLKEKEPNYLEKKLLEHKRLVYQNRTFKDTIENKIGIYKEEFSFFKKEIKEFKIKIIAELGMTMGFIDNTINRKHIQDYVTFGISYSRKKSDPFKNSTQNLLTPVDEFPIFDEGLAEFYKKLRGVSIMGINPPNCIDKEVAILGPFKVDESGYKFKNWLDDLGKMTNELQVYYEGQLQDGMFSGWGRKLFHQIELKTKQKIESINSSKNANDIFDELAEKDEIDKLMNEDCGEKVASKHVSIFDGLNKKETQNQSIFSDKNKQNAVRLFGGTYTCNKEQPIGAFIGQNDANDMTSNGISKKYETIFGKSLNKTSEAFRPSNNNGGLFGENLSKSTSHFFGNNVTSTNNNYENVTNFGFNSQGQNNAFQSAVVMNEFPTPNQRTVVMNEFPTPIINENGVYLGIEIQGNELNTNKRPDDPIDDNNNDEIDKILVKRTSLQGTSNPFGNSNSLPNNQNNPKSFHSLPPINNSNGLITRRDSNIVQQSNFSKNVKIRKYKVFEEGYYESNELSGIGLMYYSDGDFYLGHFFNGKKYGFGIHHHSESSQKVQGIYKDNQPNGKVIISQNKDHIKQNSKKSNKRAYGQLVNDFELKEKKEGLVIKNADNPEEDSYQYDYTGKHDHDIVYEGYMKNNQKSGIGMKRFASKFVYYGFFNEDIMNGIGKVVLNNGDLFYGKFEKDNYE